MTRPKPVVLCVLDGWGYRAEKDGNAIETGSTPVWHRLVEKYPAAMMETSGRHVGLPDGQMGNSEVGHTNLGAGRIVMQDLPRIDAAAASGELERNPALLAAAGALKRSGGACHLMGLLGTGGVHAQQTHIVALAAALAGQGVPVIIHGFLDGRDTPPDFARGFIADLEEHIRPLPGVRIGTLSGRYYAMDRDNRWERVSRAYAAIVDADGARFATADAAIAASYAAKVQDEFVIPCVIGDYAGMRDGDGFVFANFRADRARELTRMLAQPDFDKAPRPRRVAFAAAVAMTEYSAEHNSWLQVLFPPESLRNIFGEVVARAGLTQLRIAETEKYAHVTFFFNGGEEKLFAGEERILCPSPSVATYDLKPEMSAPEVTDKLVEAIGSGRFDVIIVNYANGDMVGHTGIMEAAVKAVETVDACLGRVCDAVARQGGVIFVTADHGNAEIMKDPVTGGPFTAHTATPVQAVLFNAPPAVKGLQDGRLCDVAPTLLELMGLPQPPEMTGRSLLIKGA